MRSSGTNASKRVAVNIIDEAKRGLPDTYATSVREVCFGYWWRNLAYKKLCRICRFLLLCYCLEEFLLEQKESRNNPIIKMYLPWMFLYAICCSLKEQAEKQ